ncbi:MAG: TfoX/Sxy family protein [Lachnospiraceae bacterium]|jgi:TfoX/Sxy family transcriptional regulator of competence genes|nr:TfoX/Sxy family protein [Lachnospiraceae bacterium]
MATSIEFIEFVCEQIDRSIYNIRYRKMFGEYMVYVDDKPILLVCDDTVFVKMLEELEEIMSDSEIETPYNGAKSHYILDIENQELVSKIIGVLEKITPVPKKK